jgi:hypothetical protein
VKKGGTYPITVTYSSTDNKQIILEFKKANSPLQKIRLNLVPGTNQTVTTNIQIPDTTDVQEGQMHHFVAYITPSDTTSNEWDAREDFMIQGNILVLNNDSSERVCRPWN